MNTEAALAVMGALWIGTVACRELHCILLIRTVCHVSGVYSKCSRSPFVFIHAIEGQHQILGELLMACHSHRGCDFFATYDHISSSSEVNPRRRSSSSERQTSTSTCSGRRTCNRAWFTCWSAGAFFLI